jgi:hypothetical protein
MPDTTSSHAPNRSARMAAARMAGLSPSMETWFFWDWSVAYHRRRISTLLVALEQQQNVKDDIVASCQPPRCGACPRVFYPPHNPRDTVFRVGLGSPFLFLQIWLLGSYSNPPSWLLNLSSQQPRLLTPDSFSDHPIPPASEASALWGSPGLHDTPVDRRFKEELVRRSIRGVPEFFPPGSKPPNSPSTLLRR